MSVIKQKLLKQNRRAGEGSASKAISGLNTVLLKGVYLCECLLQNYRYLMNCYTKIVNQTNIKHELIILNHSIHKAQTCKE